MIEHDPAFPAMEHLFAAYFHQDWVYDAETSGDVVADYLNLEVPTPEHLDALIAGLHRLSESYSESELPSLLYEDLGSYYRAIPPETYSGWLTEIAAQLRQAADSARLGQ